MRCVTVTIALASLVVAAPALAQTLPVGALTHDGPATPEQISLLLPVNGALPNTATATVRYKPASSSIWTTGHPMFRVRPEFSTNPVVGSVVDDFAWPILDLTPGTTYDVEVTVTSGGTSEVQTASFRTRSLPAAAGAANISITAGSSSSDIQTVFNSLNPGDVVEFQNGTYNVNNLEIDRSGTQNDPIHIRGASRNGVVIRDPNGYILRFRNGNHVVVENLTLQGGGTDGGVSSNHIGIAGGGNGNGTRRNTVRNVTITGVDRGINFFDSVSEALVYDNTLVGNNVWNAVFLSDNRTWDDDGINIPGYGNVAFNNSISRFGDTFAFAQHDGGGGITESRGVHYYRNEIRNSLDDLVEVDHAHGNISFYDNRSHNSSNCGSLDPLYGGPFVYARNICINPSRVNLHKWNDSNTGQFYYSNTFISTVSATGADPDVAAWYQPNNGSQSAYGFRNNLVVYRGNGITLWLESSSHDPIDWTNNSWYPDSGIQWGGSYSSLAAAKNGLPNTTPVFSGTSRRMDNDNITVSNPWTTSVSLGANSLTEVTATYTPVLSAGTSPKNSGAEIPNITDGFAGAAPDRGALISGRPNPLWGDQNSTPPPPAVIPNPPTDLDAN